MSRKLGEQKTEEASVMASTGFFSSFAVGVIIGVLGLIFISPLSKLLGSTDTILPYTKQYLFYILCGTPFMMSSLVLNNQLRFQGSAVNGMIGVTAGGVLNILLDPIFILYLNGSRRSRLRHDVEPGNRLCDIAHRLYQKRKYPHIV